MHEHHLIRHMKNQIVLFAMLFLTSCNNSHDGDTTSFPSDAVQEQEEVFPVEFLNKPLYLSPYFVCRDNIVIDDNLNFTYTTYSIGTMASADKAIIKGRLNIDGSITFSGDNYYHFSEDYKPTEILSKWNLNSSCYGDAKCLSLFSRSFNTLNGSYQETSVDFSTMECTPGY